MTTKLYSNRNLDGNWHTSNGRIVKDGITPTNKTNGGFGCLIFSIVIALTVIAYMAGYISLPF